VFNKYDLSNTPGHREVSMRMLHLNISYSRQGNMPKNVAVGNTGRYSLDVYFTFDIATIVWFSA